MAHLRLSPRGPFEAVSRVPDAAREAPVVFELIVARIVLGTEANQLIG